MCILIEHIILYGIIFHEYHYIRILVLTDPWEYIKENKKTRTRPRIKELAQENPLSTKKASTKKELVQERNDNGIENIGRVRVFLTEFFFFGRRRG